MYDRGARLELAVGTARLRTPLPITDKARGCFAESKDSIWLYGLIDAESKDSIWLYGLIDTETRALKFHRDRERCFNQA